MIGGPLWAVVPVKAFQRGKSRLGAVLADAARAELARALFAHVHAALVRSRHVDQVLVVTHDVEVRRAALARGCRVLADPPGQPRLAEVVDAGLRDAARHGAAGALVCMADLPTAQPGDFDAVARELARHDVVLVPDGEDRGTNLLALRPADLLGSCFGHADSFARHQRRARQQGLRLAVRRRPGLCFDVDGPQDLQALADPQASPG